MREIISVSSEGPYEEYEEIEIDIIAIALQLKIAAFQNNLSKAEAFIREKGIREVLLAYLKEPESEYEQLWVEMTYLLKGILKLNPKITIGDLVNRECSLIQEIIFRYVSDRCAYDRFCKMIRAPLPAVPEPPRIEAQAATSGSFTTLYNSVVNTLDRFSFSSVELSEPPDKPSPLKKYRGIV